MNGHLSVSKSPGPIMQFVGLLHLLLISLPSNLSYSIGNCPSISKPAIEKGRHLRPETNDPTPHRPPPSRHRQPLRSQSNVQIRCFHSLHPDSHHQHPLSPRRSHRRLGGSLYAHVRLRDAGCGGEVEYMLSDDPWARCNRLSVFPVMSFWGEDSAIVIICPAC